MAPNNMQIFGLKIVKPFQENHRMERTEGQKDENTLIHRTFLATAAGPI